MPKILNQEEIRRMGSNGGGAAGGGGGSFDPSMMAGFATQAWVNENYLSIEFFSKLFKAYDSAATPNEIVPNDTDSTITNIKAMFGFWTEQYLSALGQNSGGGGGGSSTLADLLDVAISSPTNGQVLMYNASTNKWYNGTVQQGSSDWNSISNKPTTIAGYGITDAKITNGTITLGSNSITPLTSSAISDMATKTWVGQQGFLTSSAISDMATQTWVGNNYLGINATALKATQLANARSLWGNSFNGTADIGSAAYPADINYAGTYHGYNDIYIKGGYILLNTAKSQVGLMMEGYAVSGTEYRATFGLHSASSSWNAGWSTLSGTDDYMLQLKVDTSRSVAKRYVQVLDGLRIGDGMLLWDSTNNAFYIQKSDGTSANLYATGGVSALGMSAGASSIDAMTFGYVTINNEIDFSDNYVIKVNNDDMYIGDSNNDAYVRFSDMCSWDGTDNWKIETNGHARFARLYLDETRYLFVDSGILYYYNGSTNKQIAFTN